MNSLRLGGLFFENLNENMVITNYFGLPGIGSMLKYIDKQGVFDPVFTLLENNENSVKAQWQNNNVLVTATYTYKDDVWSRQDTIKNKTEHEYSFKSCLSRFCLSGSKYEVYAQDGSWCIENQGSWHNLGAGSFRVTNTGLKTCDGAMPFAAIRDLNNGYGFAINVLPMGTWEINFKRVFDGELGNTIIDAGQCDEYLDFNILPGETIAMPEILFYSFDDGDCGLGSDKLHKYLLKNVTKFKKPPVIYNTWFNNFDYVNLDNYYNQVEVASQLGIELFVMDAGWFGNGLPWALCVGDWEERNEGAFNGRMRDFAQYVRSKGLKFGLWMEPERCVENAKTFKEHPEYFIKAYDGMYVTDMANTVARKHYFAKTCDLIEEYNLDMMKLDFNTNVKYDESGTAFYRYYQGLYSMMDELRKKYPNVYFEACASGGHRTEISTISHFDSHFLSDTVNPIELLRIQQGAMLRLAPANVSKWFCGAVVQDVSRYYHVRDGRRDERFVACADAVWGRVVQVNFEFMEAIYMIGGLGFTGDIAKFPESYKLKVEKMIEHYKAERDFLCNAKCYSLRTPSAKFDIENDSVFQLKDITEGTDRSLVYVFKTNSPERVINFKPEGLCPDSMYEITGTDQDKFIMSGKDISIYGLSVTIWDLYSAKIIEIRKV